MSELIHFLAPKESRRRIYRCDRVIGCGMFIRARPLSDSVPETPRRLLWACSTQCACHTCGVAGRKDICEQHNLGINPDCIITLPYYIRLQ